MSRKEGRYKGNGQGEATTLMEEKDLVWVVVRVGSHAGYSDDWVKEVEVCSSKGDERVDIFEEEVVEGWDC